MILSVFLALFLPCAGMSVVFIVYLCFLCFATFSSQSDDLQEPAKPVALHGLSDSELEKIPKVTGNGLVLGTECAICLDDIGEEQPARLIPGCHHGFHIQCADTWLSKHSVCPICRAKLDSQFLSASDQTPC